VGFKLSQAKTVAILFGKQKSKHTNNKAVLKPTHQGRDTSTFLGAIFDEHMTFKAHIEKLETKCTKLLNLVFQAPNLGQINRLY
jgi:hypothetical protein